MSYYLVKFQVIIVYTLVQLRYVHMHQEEKKMKKIKKKKEKESKKLKTITEDNKTECLY